MKNRRGKIVSKRASAHGKRMYKKRLDNGGSHEEQAWENRFEKGFGSWQA